MLNSFIYASETERNITCKVLDTCNTKYIAHPWRINIGNMKCTITKVTTILHIFSQADLEVNLKGNTSCFLQIIAN